MISNEHECVTQKSVPEISFGWLERKVSQDIKGHIFVMTIFVKKKEEQAIVANILGNKGLECIFIENDSEYQSMLDMKEGLAIYVKKHEESDSDYSQGFSFGYTVYETFQILREELRNYYKSPINFKEDAVLKLIRFKEMLTKEIDWETLKVAMLELSDFDKLLSEIQKKENLD